MKKTFVAAVSLAMLTSFAGVAQADDDPSAVAAARTIGLEGLRLAEAGNCKEAVEKLDRAEKLHHAPTTLDRLGECNIQLGHLVLGVEQLRRLTRETLAADAPPAFAAAKVRAQKALDTAIPRIGQLHITVTLPPGVQPQVSIDGEPVQAALLDLDRPTDPGAHTIEAIAPGYQKATRSIVLKDGEKLALSIILAPVADGSAPAPLSAPTTAPATQPPPSAPIEPPAEPKPQSNTLRIVGWSLIGVGAAGIVTGVIAGAMGLGTKSGLNDACDSQKRCDPGQQDNLDKLQTQATVGTIGFVVGAVGLVGGGAILLFGPKTASAATGKSVPLHGFDVGLGTVGYRGSF